MRVLLPEAPQLGEPDLPLMMAVELIRHLGRAGIDAGSSAPSRTLLHCRLLALETTDSPLDPSGRRVGARTLQLRLELHLVDRSDGRTLWRSGLLEVEELWALASAGAELSEASRRRTLQRLAARAAAQATERLEAAPAPH